MNRHSLRAAAALAIGISNISLGTALAQAADPDDRCGASKRPCGALRDASGTEARGVAANLERGGTDAAFRVTVDGQGETASEADAQRQADVALEQARIDVQVSALDGRPMLSVVPATPVVAPGEAMRFHLLTNYSAFIARAELRIFSTEQSVEGAPLSVVPVRFGDVATWQVDHQSGEKLRVVLRVYDQQGRFDETVPQDFAVSSAPADRSRDMREGPSFENQRATANIPVSGAEVTISGTAEETDARVFAFGQPVSIDRTRRFVTHQIVPASTDAISVRVESAGGGARDYRRALNVPKNDTFFVGLADFTAGHRSFGAAKLDLQGTDTADPRKDFLDGRLAFYYKGRVSDRWKLTASADTGEHPLEDLFDGFLKKDSRSFLRRLDPDLHYPVYGDDSITIEDAPTYGRFYARVESPNAHAMWGNFKTQLTGTDLIRYQRGLYGANLAWHDSSSTPAGEQRSEINVFAADPGTIGAREDFVSTGGSVYYFRNRDLAQGSERLFSEVRDRDSGLVLERRELVPGRDYEVNYIQGRVLLRDALPITADTSLFVRDSSLAGNPVWLVATYEYVPGLTRPDALTYGGRAQSWISDGVRIGATGYRQGQDQAKQSLYGADILVRYKPGTFVRGEFARSDGAGTGASLSSTGGYDFTQLSTVARKSNAYVVEGAADMAEILGHGDGRVSAYWRTREAGFSGPGELTFGESLNQFGGTADVAVASGTRFKGKVDMTDGDVTDRKAIEAGITHETANGVFGSVGVRSDQQAGQATPYSPFPAAPGFEGSRTDVAASIGYRHAPAAATSQQAEAAKSNDLPWSVSLFGQKTVDRDGGRLENDRFGVAGEIQPTQRLTLSGEVSDGDLGTGGKAKINYAMGDRGSLYLGYSLAAENPDAFTTGRLGRLTAGGRRRLGSSASVFAEGRVEHGSGPTGLTQSYGVDFEPIQSWTFGLRYERGSLADAVGGRISREVMGATVDHGGQKLRWSSAIEFRQDGSASYGDRQTWATRNQVTYKANDALRLFAKANLSLSDGGTGSDTGLDADYYELVAAAAYRPTKDDRLNLLVKYTYLADEPSPAQIDQLGLDLDYAQRSHIFAIDGTYQLTPRLAIGGKYAYRVGQLRTSRDATAPWFSSHASFWALRADYRVIGEWDLLAEVRQLSSREAQDSRLGALAAIYRHIGNHVKLGVGYNFTDYSDDLSDLSYNERGVFVNLLGKF